MHVGPGPWRRAARVAGVSLFGLVAAWSWVAPAGAAPSPKSFCDAVRAFNATRASSKDEAVAALKKLTAASPPSVKDAMRLITQQADAVDPASVLTQAAGAQVQATSLTMAGSAVAAESDQACQVTLNFTAAVPSGVSHRKVSPAGWARTVCTTFSTWGHTVNDAGANLVTAANGQTTVPDLRLTLSQFLTKAVAATQQLTTDLGAAGIPKTPNGDAFASSLRRGVGVTLLVFAGAQPTVLDLPTDAQAFQVRAQALVAKLDGAGRSVQMLVRLAETQITAPTLNAVFARQPGCAGIR